MHYKTTINALHYPHFVVHFVVHYDILIPMKPISFRFNQEYVTKLEELKGFFDLSSIDVMRKAIDGLYDELKKKLGSEFKSPVNHVVSKGIYEGWEIMMNPDGNYKPYLCDNDDVQCIVIQNPAKPWMTKKVFKTDELFNLFVKNE